MISIDPKQLSFAKKEHKKGLEKYIIRNVELSLSASNQTKLKQFIRENSEKILIGDLQQLLTLNKKLVKLIVEIDKDGVDILQKDLKKIFIYETIRGREEHLYNLYKLSKNLGIEVCPYCNRNYTTSHQYKVNVKDIEKNKYIFPAFDHFKSQTDFPLFALSFNNLIPTCSICNSSIKNATNINLRHPYNQDYITNYYTFSFTPNDYESLIGKKENIEIGINYKEGINQKVKEEIERTLQFFNTKDTYEKNHKGVIKEIINKKLIFTEKYMNELEASYKISFNDSYKILFESYYEEDKLHKRPFSKLKKDIFDDINIKANL
ncbi:hypothetical protein [Flavobacterium sp.]|uniref:hypothetical protein n=1 Tax=Flavobacterium sp. TaxID=239 RepID=UPI00286DF535|nr:hypothetical protein [Flavobacterium sp.]